MSKNISKQAFFSLLALLCLVIGWIQPFSPSVNYFIYNQLFYLLIGLSFFFQVPILSNPKLINYMYLAALLCVVGAFIPENWQLNFVKMIGLLGGVVISLIARPKIRR